MDKVKKIILISAGLVVAFVIAELAVRLFVPGVRLENYRYFEGMLHTDHADKTVKPSSKMGYELIPNSSSRINSLGMMDREYTIAKDNATYRIIVIGDSVSADPDGYTTILEEMLNKNSKAGIKYEVWNGAFPAYGIKEYRNYLKYKALNFKPDLIIIAFCLNDIGYSNLAVYKNKDGFMEFRHPYKRLDRFFNRYLFRYSFLYRLFMLGLENYWEKNQLGGNLALRFYDNLDEIKQICNDNNIKLTALIFPYLLPKEQYTKTMNDQYELILKSTEHLRLENIDFTDELRRINLKQLRKKDNDQTHFNRKGHKIIAEILFNYLKAEN